MLSDDDTSVESETQKDIDLFIAEEKSEMFSFMVTSGLGWEEIEDVWKDYKRWETGGKEPEYVKDVECKYNEGMWCEDEL